jgi:protoporphyrinogen/coproporphyrinogen III oxidase
MNRKVVVLGGGISGLAAAWFLEKKGFTDITILEASDRVGGKLRTTLDDGFLVESAADSFITTKPAALNLVQELGLDDEIIEPLTNRFFIYKNGTLHDSPKGLGMLAVIDEKQFRDSTLFTEEGKERIIEEKAIEPQMEDADESFATFITRRFGEEMLYNYAGPLFGGIYSTPTEQLSMKATFPQFLEWEQKYGSITAANKAIFGSGRREGTRSPFVSMKRGIGSLVETLAKTLKHTRIASNTIISHVKRRNGTYEVFTKAGQIINCNALISTLPSTISADILRDLNPNVAGILNTFTTSSSKIVTLAYKKKDIKGDIDATGFVSARGGDSPLTASTWSSQKWEGRAPGEYFLARCFLKSVESDASDLVNNAHEVLRDILKIDGRPLKTWTHRWGNALPQYKLGHLEKVAALEVALQSVPDFALAGAYIAGAGLPDCIAQAEKAVEKLSVSF